MSETSIKSCSIIGNLSADNWIFLFLKIEMERKATVTGNMFLEAVNASAHNTRSNTRKWTENIVTEEVVSNKLSKS